MTDWHTLGLATLIGGTAAVAVEIVTTLVRRFRQWWQDDREWRAREQRAWEDGRRNRPPRC